jgi:hypothetical protein
MHCWTNPDGDHPPSPILANVGSPLDESAKVDDNSSKGFGNAGGSGIFSHTRTGSVPVGGIVFTEGSPIFTGVDARDKSVVTVWRVSDDEDVIGETPVVSSTLNSNKLIKHS